MNITEEQWETIKDFPNYMISSEGRILNKASLKFISTSINKRHKHRAVRLWNNGKSRLLKVYRIKAIAFIPNPENKREVNHLDGDRMNEDLSNMEWSTPKENMKHSFITGLAKGQFEKGKLVKLSIDDIKLIRQWHDSGFIDCKTASKVFNVSREHIKRIGTRKLLAHV